MIIPVRCFTCGNVLADKELVYHELVKKGKQVDNDEEARKLSFIRNVDELLNKARVESDRSNRFDLYNQAEQRILDDAPWIPLWNSAEGYLLVKPEVKNYYLTPLSIPKLRYIYFEAGSGS